MDEELHIPIEVVFPEGGHYQAVCSCGEAGPLTEDPGKAKELLAEAHGAREPESGCALCGMTVPPQAWHGPNFRHPWQRYLPSLGPTGRWEYRCRNAAACRQRCLAAEQYAVSGDPWMVLDALGTGYAVSLDDTVDDVIFDLERSIEMYRLAKDASPRTWHSITSSAGDRRALAARAVALRALAETASAWEGYAVLSARRAGVTWSHLADLMDTSAEELHARVQEWYRLGDWPWLRENTPPEILEALQPDPNT